MEPITVKGYVEHIIFRNQENGYAVMEVAASEKTMTLVGTISYVNEGEYVEATGKLIHHPVYGEQLLVSRIEVKIPEDLASIERYLGSGTIKGVGQALAGRIVEKFGTETFRIIEEEPERLAQVRGISSRMAVKIAEQALKQREIRQAVIFLQKYGISLKMSIKIYEKYRDEIYSIIRSNPYQLAEDIQGIGFKIADDIAAKAGILADSDFRIRSALIYVLNQSAGNGHVYLPEDKLLQETERLLGIQISDIHGFLMDLVMDRKLSVKEVDGCNRVYLGRYYNMELDTARRLWDLNERYQVDGQALSAQMASIEKELDIALEEQQQKAFTEAARSGLLVVTGGPGTGKTTTIRSIIRYFEREGMSVELAAPTGRAAKRMKEATGMEARTIHRLLELNGIPDEEGELASARFERNENNPLETDVVIIDEMSMVDISLMNALMQAIPPGIRLILVGDVDQLPSVGPGNVLRDIIDSRQFLVVRLNKIFRQAAMSDIVVNAHRIHDGEYIDPTAKSRDFLFIRRPDANSAINACITLIRDKLPKYVNAPMSELQIMTPMRKGVLGVERLNMILQQYLNPPEDKKREKEVGGTIYRVGDKVMQIKNNYKLAWVIRNRRGFAVEEGEGVFNGDTGIIRDMNLFSEELTVEYDEHRMVTYSFKQLDELELAYAVTVHKSQGSEYPAVILPLISGPRVLMNRNLLYTAVTRAKSCVCVVGLPEAFQEMVDNQIQQERYSGLDTCICEIGAIRDQNC